MIRKIMSDQVDVKQGVRCVLSLVEAAYAKRPQTLLTAKPLLVAASKTNSAEIVAEAYSAGQRHFGENYVQELEEKSNSRVILEQCKDIKWHYIGHLQSNKVKKVINIPNIYMIQTIDSQKLANIVNTAWEKLDKPEKQALKVLVQVNTSNEEVKSGVHPNDLIPLYRHILESSKNLKVEGIMTIGAYGHDYTKGPNLDLLSLMRCHDELCKTLLLRPEDVQVSMGMSNDFEHAIDLGSSIVRVGTSIFGHRPTKTNDASPMNQ